MDENLENSAMMTEDTFLRETALRAIAQINQEQGFGIKELLEEANMIVAWLKTGEIK